MPNSRLVWLGYLPLFICFGLFVVCVSVHVSACVACISVCISFHIQCFFSNQVAYPVWGC